MTLDGGERRGPMHDVIVANGHWHGGGMKLAPDARPDDGLFDVVLIGDVGEARLRDDLAEALQGRPRRPPEGRGGAERAGRRRRRRAAADRARRRAGRDDAGAVRGRARARCACACQLLAARLGVFALVAARFVRSRASTPRARARRSAARSPRARGRSSRASTPSFIASPLARHGAFGPARLPLTSSLRAVSRSRRALRSPIASSPTDWAGMITVFSCGTTHEHFRERLVRQPDAAVRDRTADDHGSPAVDRAARPGPSLSASANALIPLAPGRTGSARVVGSRLWLTPERPIGGGVAATRPRRSRTSRRGRRDRVTTS